jgi:uncharacterized protein DUF5663
MNQQIITNELLREAGVETIDSSLLDQLNETIEERVGVKLIEMLGKDKSQYFVNLQENGSDGEVDKWVEENIPNLESIVEEEIKRLIDETKAKNN